MFNSILKSDLANNPEAGKNLEILLEKTKNLQHNNENHEKTSTSETEGKKFDIQPIILLFLLQIQEYHHI